MKKAVQILKAIPPHVLLFALYPVLALLAHNMDQVEASVALLPLAASVGGALVLLVLLRLILRDWQRAALATTLLVILFFVYGHVYSYLKAVTFSGIHPFRHRTLAPAWLVVGGLGIWWISRRNINVRAYGLVLNVVGVALFVLPIFQIGSGLWRQWRAWSGVSRAAAPSVSGANGTLSIAPEYPDIYYIILDAYGRADVLQELYRYDNSEFLISLEEMGFYVADCSQSNYAQTELSLASSLNYNYLPALGDTFVAGSDDRSPLWPLIKDSTVRRFLESKGYKTIAFKTGFSWTEITDADLFLSPQLNRWQLDEFQYMWLQTTLGRILLDAESFNMLQKPDDLSRHRTEFVLEKLQQIPSIDGPKFIFAHLIVPHPPYVFGPNGELVSIGSDIPPAKARQAYMDQITFINKRMLEILPMIIADSSAPVVVVIQGDHGSGAMGAVDRMANLSAFYLPGHDMMLYPEITNVNTFRVIFSEYFEGNFPLLPDYSFYSTYGDPFDFAEVENQCSR